MSLFILGTDTDVGKTHAACALMQQYAPLSSLLRYWKAVQTGCPPDDDRLTVMRRSGLPENRFLPTSFSFKAPESPHSAARKEGREVRVKEMLAAYESGARDGPLLIEGAGGLMVPLNDTETWLDFLRATALPSVLIARTGLGTINHSLLTLKIMAAANLKVIGIIFRGETSPEVPEASDAMHAILSMSGIPKLGQLRPEDMPSHEKSAAADAAHADPDCIVLPFISS